MLLAHKHRALRLQEGGGEACVLQRLGPPQCLAYQPFGLCPIASGECELAQMAKNKGDLRLGAGVLGERERGPQASPPPGRRGRALHTHALSG